MKAVLALMFAASALATPVHATDWFDAGKNAKGDQIWIDTDSYRDTPPIRSSWAKIDLAKPRPEGTVSFKLLVEVKCQSQTYLIRTSIGYGADGSSTLTSRTAPSYADYEPIIPETVMSALSDLMCSIGK